MWHHTIFCFKKYFFVVLLSLLLIIMRREQKYQKFIIILLFFCGFFTKLSQAFLVLDSFFFVCFIHILYTMDFFFLALIGVEFSFMFTKQQLFLAVEKVFEKRRSPDFVLTS